ncbi:MAG: Hsp70 family protein [Acidobacteriota bacterium]
MATIKKAAFGIDFGTTNSSIARADASGAVEMVRFASGTTLTEAYRSLLYLEQVTERNVKTVKSWSGPEGIERYLAAETKGRLIQSLKSFLSSESLRSTEVFGRRRTLEELIARILRDLREKAERHFAQEVRSAVVGRPVQFVGAEREEQNAFAEKRLTEAFLAAGFETVQFEMEPVAAAHYYESRLDHDELILIGDFGGGTSDFSLVHVGPSILKRGRTPKDLIGNAGLGLAGDAFDSKIVRHMVSPALGAGTEMRSMNKVLPVPGWLYSKLEHWHHLSFLKAKDTLNMLRSVRGHAFEPERIEALLHLIQEDLGYELHRAVQKTKCELSEQEAARFVFSDGMVGLDQVVRRSDFEEWIQDELGQIEGCVDGLLAKSGVDSSDVDRVFLTGGTSFVPAVRRIFEARFGKERIRAGNEFTSVARGLALKAL